MNEARAARVTSLLTDHVRVQQGDRVVLLHVSAPEVVLSIARQCRGGSLVVVHRRAPVVHAIERALAGTGLSHVSVVHAHGRLGASSEQPADVVLIDVPAERASAQQLLYDAAVLLRIGGRCLLAGGTTAGIKPAVHLLQRMFGNTRTVAQGAGHRIVEATRGDTCDLSVVVSLVEPYQEPQAFREMMVEVNGAPTRVFTRPGVFSWDHLDEATAILAQVLTVQPSDDVLDLGCGAGVLGATVAARAPLSRLTLVDADSEAVRCAERTMRACGHERWRVLASDVIEAVASDTFDYVVTNPPFHTGQSTDLDLPRRFMKGAHRVLRRGGRLQLVANRTLPYERELEQLFGNRRVLHDGVRFKVLEAVRQ